MLENKHELGKARNEYEKYGKALHELHSKREVDAVLCFHFSVMMDISFINSYM